MTPVLKPAQVATLPHYVERGTFVDGEAAEGVTGKVASGFFEIDGSRVGYVHRSPSAGEHSAEVLAAEVFTAEPKADWGKPAVWVDSFRVIGRPKSAPWAPREAGLPTSGDRRAG